MAPTDGELFCPARQKIDAEAGPSKGGIVVGTNAAAMSFDDGLTDRQAHPHAGVFGREEPVEKTGEMFRIDARAAVLDGAAHRLRIQKQGPDGDAAVRGCNLRHRLDGIEDQIDDDLRELDAVSHDLGQLIRELEGDSDLFQQQLMAQEAQRLIDDVIDRQQLLLGRALARHVARAFDDLGGPTRVGDHAACGPVRCLARHAPANADWTRHS